jgi:hypothetical protein
MQLSLSSNIARSHFAQTHVKVIGAFRSNAVIQTGLIEFVDAPGLFGACLWN